MAKAPVVTELPLQSVRFLFGTMVDLRMLPQVLEQTGRAEVGEFKLVAHFPEQEKVNGNEAGYLARHKGFRGGDYNTYHGDPYTLDETKWDATGRAGIHLVTKTKYGQTVEFPTIPDKNDTAELMLIVSEYVESIKTPPLIVRCSGIGGTISPLGNKKYALSLSTGATKCPTSIKDHVPKKYHAEDMDIIPYVGGAEIFSAEDLSPDQQEFIGNQIARQMQGYYRTGVIGVDPVIGAFPNGPMSIAKRTPEAKQDFFRQPAVQDDDGLWNKGPNRWQAHKIAQGVAYDQLERAQSRGLFSAEADEFGGSAGVIYGERPNGELIPLMQVSNNSYNFVVNDVLPEGVVHNEKGGTDDAVLSKTCAMILDGKNGIFTRVYFEPHGLFSAEVETTSDGFMINGHKVNHEELDKFTENLVAYRDSAYNRSGYSGTQEEWHENEYEFDDLEWMAEDYAAESLLLCSEHDDYFNACGCGTKNAEHFAATSTATPNLKREKSNLRSAIHNEIDSKFEYSQCVWGPYALRMEGATTNKFYMVFVYDNGNGVFRALGGYGGLGQNPRLFDVMTTRDQSAAIAAATRKLKAKERKGYFTYNSEEGSTPVQEPMELGEMANWTPMDGSPGLKRQRAEHYGAAESNFSKLARKISMQYQDKGKSIEEADEIGRRTAYTIGAKKYGKRGMTRKAMAGRKSAEDIPVWNDGIVQWETSGPMSPTGSGYSSASAPPTGVIAGPGDTFLNYTEAQNYLVETSGGLWGAEHFEAMSRVDPKSAQDVKKVKDALKQRYQGIKINRIEYITNRRGASNKYHVFAFTNRGVFNGYGRIGTTMTLFGPMTESQGVKKMDTKMRRGGYKEQV